MRNEQKHVEIKANENDGKFCVKMITGTEKEEKNGKGPQNKLIGYV